MSNDLQWFRSLYPFQGDPFSKQLRFPAGILIAVPANSKPQGGWIYGRLEQGEKGWFPISYVVPINNSVYCDPLTYARDCSTTQISPIGAAGSNTMMTDPFLSTNFPSKPDFNSDGGFDGPIMGGSPTASISTEPTEMSDSMTEDYSDSSSSKATSIVGNSFRKAGSGIVNITSKSGKGIRSAAAKTGQGIRDVASKTGQGISKTGQGISNAAKETKYRVQDMQEQKRAQNAAPTVVVKSEQTPVIKSSTKRSGFMGRKTTTTTEQTTVTKHGTTKTITETKEKRNMFGSKKTETTQKTETIPHPKSENRLGKNIGNGAARGAVTGAIVGTLYGNPIRGATRGAVCGGAWSATNGWKPFG